MTTSISHADAAVAIRGVRKTFGPKVAVQELDLTIPRGALCGFIGPNGAGKTTTIRMIMSIIFPDQGQISVLGKASAVESKDRIGYLPEERGVYRKMKVGAFLNYMARLKSVDGRVVDRRVRAWLDRVALPQDVYKKKCEELSKGMQQKIQFIAAVIHEPELLILDEVFSGLDPENRVLMRQLIDAEYKRGCTIIFSTHALFEAEQLCDQIFMIDEGNKLLDGPLDEIIRRYDSQQLVAEPLNKAEIDAASDAVSQLPGVERVEQSEDRSMLVVTPRAAADGSRAAHRLLVEVASAWPMRGVQMHRVSLEEIFLRLVKKADAATGAAATGTNGTAGIPREILTNAGREASS